MQMDVRVRARVLIPTLLFMLVALPALLVPTVAGHEAGPSPAPQGDAGEADPLKRETDWTPRNFEWRVTSSEINEYLESYIGD